MVDDMGSFTLGNWETGSLTYDSGSVRFHDMRLAKTGEK